MNNTLLKRLLMLCAVLENKGDYFTIDDITEEQATMVDQMLYDYIETFDTDEVKRECIELVELLGAGVR